MNLVSNSCVMPGMSEDPMSTRRNANTDVAASEESLPSQKPVIQRGNYNESSNENLEESSDADLMRDQNANDVKVIVSPKSSMISSRLAEPETAEIMAYRLMEFWSKHSHEVPSAVERAEL